MKVWAVFLVVVDTSGYVRTELLALFRSLKDADAAYSSALVGSRDGLPISPDLILLPTHIIESIEVQ